MGREPPAPPERIPRAEEHREGPGSCRARGSGCQLHRDSEETTGRNGTAERNDETEAGGRRGTAEFPALPGPGSAPRPGGGGREQKSGTFSAGGGGAPGPRGRALHSFLPGGTGEIGRDGAARGARPGPALPPPPSRSVHVGRRGHVRAAPAARSRAGETGGAPRGGGAAPGIPNPHPRIRAAAPGPSEAAIAGCPGRRRPPPPRPRAAQRRLPTPPPPSAPRPCTHGWRCPPPSCTWSPPGPRRWSARPPPPLPTWSDPAPRPPPPLPPLPPPRRRRRAEEPGERERESASRAGARAPRGARWEAESPPPRTTAPSSARGPAPPRTPAPGRRRGSRER